MATQKSLQVLILEFHLDTQYDRIGMKRSVGGQIRVNNEIRMPRVIPYSNPRSNNRSISPEDVYINL